jgi:uracil-DNA glycosylase
MDRLAEILDSAELGNHHACKNCARNPKENPTSFARNCDEHFGVKPNGLIIIARDPGANQGGSSHTRKLCPIHNNDATARRVLARLDLFQLPYQSIYFLNAILHGYFNLNYKANNNVERNNCKYILRDIFCCLTPRAILALGVEALQSSKEILRSSEIKKPTLEDMIFNDFSFGKISSVHLFAIPHPAYARVNLGKYGVDENEVWEQVAIKINNLF